jgi:hypothetical protein
MNAEIKNNKIFLTFPFGTINFNNLVSYFKHSGEEVFVNGTKQISGETKNNFTNGMIYEIKSIDGTSKNFTVEMKILKTRGIAYSARLTTGTDRYADAEFLSNATASNLTPTNIFHISLAFDKKRDILYVPSGASGENFIRVYENASINANIVNRTITIPGANRIAGVSLDEEKDTLYLINRDSNGAPSTLRFIFRINNVSSKNGTISQGTDFDQLLSTSLHLSNSGIRRMLYDRIRDNLYVCEYNLNQVFIYQKISTILNNQNTEPALRIPITLPTGLAMDFKNETLFISSETDNRVYVFDEISKKTNLIHDRIISSPQFNKPFGLDYIYELNRLYVANFTPSQLIYFNYASKINSSVMPNAILNSVTSISTVRVDIYR